MEMGILPSTSLAAFDDAGTYIPTLMVAGVIIIVVIRTIGGAMKSNARERTRREIAAYIAEGSMTPEQGERLMKAGNKD